MKKWFCVLLSLVLVCVPLSVSATQEQTPWQMSEELKVVVDYLEQAVITEKLPDGSVQYTLPDTALNASAPTANETFSVQQPLYYGAANRDYAYTTGQTHTRIPLEKRYLYSLLSDELKTEYRKIDQAVRRIDSTVVFDPSFRNSSDISAATLYFLYMFDTPELVYLGNTGTTVNSAESVEFRFCYAINPTEFTGVYGSTKNTDIAVLRPKIVEKQAAFDKAVADFVSTIPKNAPQLIQESLIYAKLVLNSHYNLGASFGGFLEDNWTAYGVICNKYGVCESYAEAFQTLCNAVGIECTGVIGTAGGGHKWNAVKIDGNWYQCDPTFDDPIGGGDDHISFHYFNLTDKQMAECAHDWSSMEYDVPTCTATQYGRDYFRAFYEYDNGTLHTFVNRCDTTCQNCSFTRDVPDHEYADDESVDCLYCDYRRPKGWRLENGTWYFYRAGERVCREWVADSHGLCYLGYDGALATNQFIYEDGEETCYVGGSGYILRNTWISEFGSWFYLDKNSKKLKNCWFLWNGDWYHFDENGYMEVQVWKRDSKGWCYLNASGKMIKNQWLFWNGDWYFIDSNGYMLANCWKKDSVGWCYLGGSGSMLRNAWVRDSQSWCYVGYDGYCVTDEWRRDSTGKYCYLDKNGRMVVNSWVTKDGCRYYCDKNGYRVTGKQVIGGVQYRFSSEGVLL